MHLKFSFSHTPVSDDNSWELHASSSNLQKCPSAQVDEEVHACSSSILRRWRGEAVGDAINSTTSIICKLKNILEGMVRDDILGRFGLLAWCRR